MSLPTAASPNAGYGQAVVQNASILILILVVFMFTFGTLLQTSTLSRDGDYRTGLLPSTTLLCQKWHLQPRRYSPENRYS